MQTTNEEWEPDIFDVNDWLALKHPELYALVKYSSASVLYEFGLKVWKEKGKPDIDAILAVEF